MKKLILSLPLFCAHLLSGSLLDYVQEATTRPIAFAVAREDSVQDLEVITRYFSGEKVSMLMVASGGCTAAKLIADAPLLNITLVDPNLAQLQLSKLKIQLLTFPIKKRMEILGYLPMKLKERKTILLGLMQALEIDKTVFGDIELAAQLGLDYIGAYERVFEELRAQMRLYRSDLEALFTLTSVEEQSKRIAPETALGKALDRAFDEVLSQQNLIGIFGEKATNNRLQEFSRHFAERTRAYLSTHLASSSPWMANMLLGHFYRGVTFPWLTASSSSEHFPNIAYFHGDMDAALRQSKRESYEVVHLSNIIDWLTPNEAEKILKLAYRALKPGGVVIIRQLNSNIAISSIGKEFEWDLKASCRFLADDRSFFYRNFFLGFKPRPSAAPKVKALSDAVLREIPVIQGSFFQALPSMSKEEFQKAQMQFFFAVDYFSRPMSALIARLPLHEARVDILHNIVEEHGDFVIERTHSNTFRQFLYTIGISKNRLEQMQAGPVVNAFNYALMGVSANEDPITAIACNGIIEYAFADISALIGEEVVRRNWVKKENLVHYNLHATVNKRHAEEFFKLLEPYVGNPEQEEKIISGLRLGAYLFYSLYEDLYKSR